MKKALAYYDDCQDRHYVCCACIESQMQNSEYKELFYTTTRPTQVAAHIKCRRCGYDVGGHDAEMAAGRIAKMLKGE